jgi:hypothetical protein
MCELNGTVCVSTIICGWCKEEYTELPENQACINCNASGHWAEIDSPVGQKLLSFKNKFAIRKA